MFIMLAFPMLHVVFYVDCYPGLNTISFTIDSEAAQQNAASSLARSLLEKCPKETFLSTVCYTNRCSKTKVK